MKKTLILIVCTLAVGALAAVAEGAPPEPVTPAAEPCLATAQAPVAVQAPELFTPAPEQKDPCHRCFGLLQSTSPGGGAASHWGMGSSCGAAQTDLENQLWSAAAGICVDGGALGACSLTVVVTGSCFWNGSMYQVDGYATFKCMHYLC